MLLSIIQIETTRATIKISKLTSVFLLELKILNQLKSENVQKKAYQNRIYLKQKYSEIIL